MQSSYLRGRRSIVPCANILGMWPDARPTNSWLTCNTGGGSSINFQMYTRASASDWGKRLSYSHPRMGPTETHV